MSYTELKQWWRGISAEEIGAKMQKPRTAEEVKQAIEWEIKKLEEGVFDGVIKRAISGDIAAIEWLEKRGYISLKDR